MLICYPSPVMRPDSGITYSGAQLTSLAGLRDGRSGGLTILEWEGSSVELRASFPIPIAPRAAALVNIGLPAGLLVEVALKRVGEGYDYLPVEVQTHETASGEVAVLALWPEGLDLVDGVQFVISDENGVVEPETEFWVGELVLSAGLDFDMEAGWRPGVETTAGSNMSLNGQPYLQPVPSQRTIAASVVPVEFGSAMIGPGSMQDLRFRLAEDPRTIIVPDTSTQSAAEATWIYGVVRRMQPMTGHAGVRRLGWGFEAVEMVGRAT